MAFHVDVIPQALAEIDSIYRQIAPVAPENASRWLIGIADTIYSLESMPGRCPLAVAESEELAARRFDCCFTSG
jgi:plasmid stabilization system protein ParE